MLGAERLVEARISGIEFEDDGSAVRVRLKAVGGIPLCLMFLGIERLLISEVREQNIVDRLNIWDSNSDLDGCRSLLVELIGGNANAAAPRWPETLNAELNKIASGARVLAEIEAVYGAEFLVLAQRVEIVQSIA